jgi:hypothetical protein
MLDVGCSGLRSFGLRISAFFRVSAFGLRISGLQNMIFPQLAGLQSSPAQAPPNRRNGPLTPPDTLRIPFGYPSDTFRTPCGLVDWCLAIAPRLPLYHLPAVRLPSCSTGKRRTFGILCLSLTANACDEAQQVSDFGHETERDSRRRLQHACSPLALYVSNWILV